MLRKLCIDETMLWRADNGKNAQVRKWFSELQSGVISAVDSELSGRPSTAEKVATWFE